MTIRLQEVVRSEVEGGLSGPANPIPSQSIDCGCGQLPCPKLAKFATRRLFVGLMSWVGLIQAAAYAYLYVASPTIARRFQFDPYIMEWVLVVSELTPFLFGLFIAYWGDRIHRAAWVGGLVLLQSVFYFIVIIPHLTHNLRVIEETDNVTHMSLYADDSPELCSPASSRIVIEHEEPCYFTLGVLVAVQIMSGIANIAYYALGISYLDDNTKTKHVGAFIGVILAVKIMGVLLGYILAWGCLRIDAETLSPVGSYKEQIGAWWLGFPILSLLLIIPGLLLAWFPRMLPSEIVEQAAASLLNTSGTSNRSIRRLNSRKVGSSTFWPSMGRLFTNKVLIFNILAGTFYITAILNFMNYENVFLESRFYVPKPTGMLLGFGDTMISRLTTNIVKPILIGLIIIISGLVIAKAKPSARFITGYGIIVILVSSAIIFSLSVVSCNLKPIVGMDNKGVIFLRRYCNKDCGCSIDADFRPVCDTKGMFTFYSPCHAGCTSSETKDGTTIYSGCSCVEDQTGKGNREARDGACGWNDCQIDWLLFEFGTLLAYTLVASTFVGDLLITLRSVYAQDKAISIGFWMMWTAIVVNVPGKILYDLIANLTCQYWGGQRSICHLHDSSKLADYLCYLTGSLLVLSFLFKILVWLFSNNLKLYVQQEDETRIGAEMQELIQIPDPASRQQTEPSNSNNNGNAVIRTEVHDDDPLPLTSPVPLASPIPNENPPRDDEAKQTQQAPLKYGPLGPGDRRTDHRSSPRQTQLRRPRIRNLDSEDELSSSDDEQKKGSSPKVAYKPLDLDSDVESDLSSIEPRSRKRISGRDYDRVYSNDHGSVLRSSPLKREFPNPDHYGDPRSTRNPMFKEPEYLDGSSKTSSFEFSKIRGDKEARRGDFNEVGIPIIEPNTADRVTGNYNFPNKNQVNRPRRDGNDINPSTGEKIMLDEYLERLKTNTSDLLKKGQGHDKVKSLINQYEQNQDIDGDEVSVRSDESVKRTEGKIVSGIPLVAMVPKRPSSRSQSSSNYNSADDRTVDGRSDSLASNSPKYSNKGSRGTLHTDL